MRYTVFCGSSMGNAPEFEQAAEALGQALALNNIGLVYGGAHVGLMGKVADGALSHSGEVIGVLPHFLHQVEIAHTQLTQLILVDTMHERKAKMDELSDGVIALPGGYGTLEEFFEMLTWAQLGLHQKPVALLNVLGFYDSLISLIDNMVSQGFLKAVNRDMIVVDDNISGLLEKMKNYQAPHTGKWIKKEQI